MFTTKDESSSRSNYIDQNQEHSIYSAGLDCIEFGVMVKCQIIYVGTLHVQHNNVHYKGTDSNVHEQIILRIDTGTERMRCAIFKISQKL